MSCPCDNPPPCKNNCQSNSNIRLCIQNFSPQAKQMLKDKKMRATFWSGFLWPNTKKEIKVFFMKDASVPYIERSYYFGLPTRVDENGKIIKIDPIQTQIDKELPVAYLPINGVSKSVITVDKAIEYIKKILEERYNKFLGIKFVFVDNILNSDVRVSFNNNDTSESAIGNESAFFIEMRSLTLGWFDVGTTLHEFGHSLGLLHEHEILDFAKKFDPGCVCDSLSKPPNSWSPSKICSAVFDDYSSKITVGSQYDPDSIMLYGFPKSFTTDCTGTSNNVRLSGLDVLSLAKYYPGGDMTPQQFYQYAYGEDIKDTYIESGKGVRSSINFFQILLAIGIILLFWGLYKTIYNFLAKQI